MWRPITQAIGSSYIFKASIFWGIFPFKVTDNELKADKLLVLYSTVLNSCVTILQMYPFYISMYTIFLNRTGIIPQEIAFSYVITLCCYFLQTFLLLSYPIYCYFNRNTLIDIVLSLDAMEPFFNKLEGKTKKEPIQKWTFSITLCASLLIGIVLYFLGNTFGSIVFATRDTFLLVGTTLICGQFSYFVDTVGDFFPPSSKFLIRVKHLVSFVGLMALEKVVGVVSDLVTTSNKINAFYSKQLLLTISTCYSSAMIHLYFIYLNAHSKDGWKHLIHGDVLMALYYIFLVWRLTSSAAQAKQKSKEFNTLLYQLMIEDKDNKILDNTKLMLHISMKREVEFTVCGFFNLDYTLVHSMIASATTYLVILIQFGDYGPKGQATFANLTTTLTQSMAT